VTIDPAEPRQLEKLLGRHRITLRHRLGQNFLVDPAIRDRIADSAGIGPSDEVLEVGAGVGTLTIALAARARRVLAVEIDRSLLPALREVIGDRPNVEVVEGDVLRLGVTGEVVTGNIPYNLTGALIRKLLDHQPRPKTISLVVQKEVAERWTAPTSASLSTVAVQMYTVPRLAFTIPASAFTPQPRVDSALALLAVRPEPAVDVDDMDRFFRFVESVFQFRRKQLGGILTRFGAGKEVLNQIEIEPTRRPQTLTLLEWENLYRAVNPRLDR
jgi:16S rRNA (adenine1518-N6/adenine1519-N6)-dimethyltransferase